MYSHTLNTINMLALIGRSKPLIVDLPLYEERLRKEIERSSFLVIGGAGSIGQAVVKEIFARGPRRLHVVDTSENNLVELVRDIRSEKDPYTLMRMVDVNILNTIKTIEMSIASGTRKYFCVSTDKATNPVNMMGASKRIMEMFLQRFGERIPISTARFANVAFSDGSLLYGFQQRLLKGQPIAAPNDVRRYFVTPQESGELCLMSAIFGKNGEIFFPKLSEELHMRTFSEIAVKFLKGQGYEAVACASEEEARQKVKEFKGKGQWPCYFSASDTTGEKGYEEFYASGEAVDLERFESLGVVKNTATATKEALDYFLEEIRRMKEERHWRRDQLITLFQELLPGFNHDEKGRFLAVPSRLHRQRLCFVCRRLCDAV
jgi:FlaA1/EpsC-like NDP-sugar epimerase